jgi:hypothetical protein
MLANAGLRANFVSLGRHARDHAARSAVTARYRQRPPAAATSRDTVDGARPRPAAIARNDQPAARPRQISSRSDRLSSAEARDVVAVLAGSHRTA